jgi:indole-3-glycerol phosphate synthase
MSDLLKTIIEHKKTEIRLLRQRRSSFTGRSDTPRNFIKAIKGAPGLAVIAEIKKASPSRGVIVTDFNPTTIAGRYEQGKATAISVLTEVHYFQGSPDYITEVRKAATLPVLRKDFIIDPLQVEETASLNADAMLLIAAALSNSQLEELLATAQDLEITPLIEIHDGRELDRVMRCNPVLIGINNRDLSTFTINIKATLDLMRVIPKTVTVISESGIATADDTRPMIAAGVRGVLVGEALMRAEDPGDLIRQLRNQPAKTT